MISKGQFDALGKCHFTNKHTYSLPPYLKSKYGFFTDTRFYNESVLDWAELHQINDLKQAQENRSIVLESSLVRSQVARGKPKLDLLKCQDNESYARLHRFEGFTDYDILDNILLAK